jgi:hypothetical protein
MCIAYVCQHPAAFCFRGRAKIIAKLPCSGAKSVLQLLELEFRLSLSSLSVLPPGPEPSLLDGVRKEDRLLNN